MVDYELITVPNVGSPIAGILCMTVSENRVGLQWPVLDALDRPDRIMIHRGVKSNEGKLVIGGTDDSYGSIPLDYERKRIGFFNRTFVGLCKEMVVKYGGGKFNRGIYYTVKRTLTKERTVEFDFHDVMYREVKVYARAKSATGKYTAGKQKAATKGKSAGRSKSTPARNAKTMTDTERQGFNNPMGFSMPGMGAAMGGLAY